MTDWTSLRVLEFLLTEEGERLETEEGDDIISENSISSPTWTEVGRI